MSAAAPARVLVRCDGAAAPGGWAGLPWTRALDVTSRGPKADLNLRIDDLAGVLGAEVGDRAGDLVRIAAYAYLADRLVSRGGDRDADAARWRRHFALCVPVADPAYWGDPAVTERLVAALQFLTDDRWDFAFGSGGPGQRQLHLLRGARPLHREPGAVVLFSGGADSLAVLLEAALAGERPLAVGHWSAPPHEARQRALLDRLRERLPAWSFPPLGLRIHGVGAEPPERTQRTRAFLFAALGAAVAAEVGVERVLLGDNGPTSLNLPISAQLVGALASRSTHPKFLAGVNRLLAGVFPAPVRVENPLWARTRAEGLTALKEAGCADLLQETLSCSRWSRLPGATPQCGACSQCVDRRFAAIAAGLEAHDRAERYARDVFLDALPEGHDRTTAESYVRFAQDVHGRADDDLLAAYPQLFDAVLPEDPDPAGTLGTLVDLLRRHARTVLRVLETETARHLPVLVAGRLPATCLLRLALAAPVAVPVASPVPEPEPASPPEPSTTDGTDDPFPGVASGAQNVFARSGDVWTLAFGGRSVHLAHVVGLSLIAAMLDRPGTEFTPFELAGAARLTGDRDVASEAEARAEGLREPRRGALGTLIDPRAKAEYRNEVDRLLGEVEEARDAGNQALVARLEGEIKRVLHEIDAATGLLGELRRMEDEVSTLRGSLNTAIRRAQAKIEGQHPHLARHLQHSLKRRVVFAYAPEAPTTWHVRLH